MHLTTAPMLIALIGLDLIKMLTDFAHSHGSLIYAALFAIVYGETGLVFLPFLPGDSLLFASGAVGAAGVLNIPAIYVIFLVAAFLGDNTNYWVGRKLGRQLFQSETSKIFKQSNLLRTEAFFAQYGPKAIIMARFVPVVRTFAPFVAGMGQMQYAKFLAYSLLATVLWVGVCVTGGVMLGQVPFFVKHFELLVVAVIVVSFIPIAVEMYLHKRRAAQEAHRSNSASETAAK